jgi:heme ABC exporter ATP-binding subunit CcmA
VSNPQNGYAIYVEGLHKSFGDWPVLWDLDLKVEWGQFLALFGVNGAGKTTLLRVLSTQARADAGKILVAGYDSRRQAEAIRRCIGVVGHQGLVYEDLTCRENLVFYGRLFALGDIHQRVEAVLSRVGLHRRADHRVRTLSHGMQKRLAIARAVLHQPRILLMDEPEGGLDRESVAMLKGLLEEWTQTGGTVIMTTHNVELGLAWAHRTAVLANGKVQFQDDPDYGGPAEIQRLLTTTSAAGLARPMETQL